MRPKLGERETRGLGWEPTAQGRDVLSLAQRGQGHSPCVTRSSDSGESLRPPSQGLGGDWSGQRLPSSLRLNLSYGW